MRTRVLIVIVLLLSLAPLSFAVPHKAAQKKASPSVSRRKTKRKAARKVNPVRLRRIKKAFVASNDLKPMARQLLESRTPAAYAGVESYARKHGADDAGALANLALGYAHILDHDAAQAVPPLMRAREHAGDLADYVTYFLGDAQQAAGQSAEALLTLRDFSTKYPDSVFVRNAGIVAANASLATGDAARAISLLEKYRLPTQADVELSLAKAQLRAGDTDKAADTLRHLYYSMPLAPEADQADSLLRSSAGGLGGNFALQKTRADLFAKAARYRDAAKEYRDLLDLAAPGDRDSVQVALAGALHRGGDDRQARSILERMTPSAPEINAERLFYLCEIARADNEDDRVVSLLGQLRQAASSSSWLEQALLSTGNFYLLRADYDHAIDAYRELRERFPQGKYAAYAHWKVAWLSLRQGRNDEARRGFEEQIVLYPASPQVPAAMYWRARLAQDDERDSAKARLYYAKLESRFRNYYYAELARARLGGLRLASESVAEPLLEKIPPAEMPAASSAEPPADNLRLQKARLLQNGGMTDLAVRELRAAAAEENDSTWVTSEIARLYRDNGEYYRALEVLKRAVPSYFSLDLASLPRAYWEDLFPRPYWTDLKRYSVLNGLDPFLVASLIRQESEFNPGAVSHANAIGLMQLLPATGKKVAKQLRVRKFSKERLLLPEINLQLGTRFFRDMVDQYNGRLEYALAAYNAGTDRVDAWLAAGKFRDPEEFVESIPFTETREYVQAILRNAMVYKRLYGQP